MSHLGLLEQKVVEAARSSSQTGLLAPWHASELASLLQRTGESQDHRLYHAMLVEGLRDFLKSEEQDRIFRSLTETARTSEQAIFAHDIGTPEFRWFPS